MSRRAWLFTGIVGMVVALVAVIVFAAKAFGAPDNVREYIHDTYTRAASLDEPNDGRVYTAKGAPSAVADELARAWRPLDKRDTDGHFYLQYGDDLIAVLPHRGATKIVVDDYRTGRNRHSRHTNTYGWPGDSAGTEDGFRDGGPGDGK